MYHEKRTYVWSWCGRKMGTRFDLMWGQQRPVCHKAVRHKVRSPMRTNLPWISKSTATTSCFIFISSLQQDYKVNSFFAALKLHLHGLQVTAYQREMVRFIMQFFFPVWWEVRSVCADEFRKCQRTDWPKIAIFGSNLWAHMPGAS